ncbi:hypothetical protein Leryth_019910 [Lithospermum erythrorhizon]|nr:hypothetical protein Leryth_019910 [Lithospermum erythrorhizon]
MIPKSVENPKSGLQIATTLSTLPRMLNTSNDIKQFCCESECIELPLCPLGIFSILEFKVDGIVIIVRKLRINVREQDNKTFGSKKYLL